MQKRNESNQYYPKLKYERYEQMRDLSKRLTFEPLNGKQEKREIEKKKKKGILNIPSI